MKTVVPSGSGARVVVFITSPGGAEARIMGNIASALRASNINHEVRYLNRNRGFHVEHLTLILRSDVILLHSPLFMSLHYAIWARLLGKRVVSIVWDSYPVTLGGVRFDRRLRRRLFDWMENAVLWCSNRILVPSVDFLRHPILNRARAVKLWYAIRALSDQPRPASSDAPLAILFAGQINRTRGLCGAVEQLDRVTQGRFHLLIASGDPLPTELRGHANVRHLGKLDRQGLREVAASCDCGLVSLAHDFDGPGLPSKTFEYLEAGIPCVYHGKRLEHYLAVLEDSGAGIEIASCPSLTRADILAKKQGIAEAAARFSDAFALDPESFIASVASVEG